MICVPRWGRLIRKSVVALGWEADWARPPEEAIKGKNLVPVPGPKGVSKAVTNIFKKRYAIVNLEHLKALPAGSTVSPDSLMQQGIVKNLRDGLKILGNGELPHALTISAHFFSESAKEKITRAGGKFEVLK
jgi:ribosomal protein L15